MSLDDNLLTMEWLRSDLSKVPSQGVSPAWHGDAHRSRWEQLQQGNASFQNWESAMGDLRAELHGHQAP
jgi:hypothetical protein